MSDWSSEYRSLQSTGQREGCLGRGGQGLTCLCEEFKADSPCPVEVPEQGNGIAERAFKGADMAEVCG